MNRVSSRHVNWIDVENPNSEDIDLLLKKHTIHPLVKQELLVATYRPKLDVYDDHLYLVLHFPVFDRATSATLGREIDFIIYSYTLITVHYEPIDQLDDFQELLAGHEALRERNFGSSSAHLLYHIIRQLYLISLKELDRIEEKIKYIQDQIFNGREKEAFGEIARMKRDMLNFQKALKPQETVLNSMREHSKHFFNMPGVDPYFNDIKGEYVQLKNTVDDVRSTLDVLYDTNLSLMSANTNEVMKMLTSIASVLLPVTLIGTIFGMNVESIPYVNHPRGFWIVVMIMIAVSFMIYSLFRKKGWL